MTSLSARLLCAAWMLCCAVSSLAHDLSGQWISDEFGYTVIVKQEGDVVHFIADESFSKSGYESIRQGEVISVGHFNGSMAEGVTLFFNHESTVRKCGVPARATARFSYELSADRTTLKGTETATNTVGTNCVTEQRTSAISWSRISVATKNGCPQIVPIKGRKVSSAKLVKHYGSYLKSILAPSSSVFARVAGSVTRPYSMAQILQEQFGSLQADAVPALINDKLPLLSEAVKRSAKADVHTDVARTLFSSNSPNDKLATMAMCVGGSEANSRFYELNIYGLDKASCKALHNSLVDPVKSIRVNGDDNGECAGDIAAIDWKPWQRAGRNQVTLVINPWATSLH